MKIPTMKRAGSDNKQTTFRTDPPLTEEILECAIKNFLGESYRDQFSVEKGLLVVSRVGIAPADLSMWEERFTEAEKFLQKQQTRTETAREGDLQGRAKTMGVLLED